MYVIDTLKRKSLTYKTLSPRLVIESIGLLAGHLVSSHFAKSLTNSISQLRRDTIEVSINRVSSIKFASNIVANIVNNNFNWRFM